MGLFRCDGCDRKHRYCRCAVNRHANPRKEFKPLPTGEKGSKRMTHEEKVRAQGYRRGSSW